jgi:hypothetical protein
MTDECKRPLGEQLHRLVHKSFCALEEILENGSYQEKLEAAKLVLEYSGNLMKDDKLTKLCVLLILSNLKTYIPEEERKNLQQEIINLVKYLQENSLN